MAQPPNYPPQQRAAAGPVDLPQHARERLTAMRQHHFFTSDLSVNEFLLVKEVGFEPLGLVMGSSIYHIGFAQVSNNQSAEMTNMTQALYHARELAMTRMEEEADELEADGIVGVRLEVNLHAWGRNIIEFLAIGTAIRHMAGQEGWRTANSKPFQSDLSGQDLWTLLRAGYRPLGFVMGNCVYHIASQNVAWGQQQQNMELTTYTQALYDSRELAMERMQYEATELGAEGIVGVTVEQTNHTWGYNVIEFSAVGTAVIAISKDHKIPVPSLILSVND